jgi:hypothetical protein
MRTSQTRIIRNSLINPKEAIEPFNVLRIYEATKFSFVGVIIIILKITNPKGGGNEPFNVLRIYEATFLLLE